MDQHPLLANGFRSFFLLGALNAVGSIGTWLAFLAGVPVPTQGWPATTLHAHEMLHGTVVPAIAGFLLTAVPNWSGTKALRGGAIAALVALWLVGRVAMAVGDEAPLLVVALADLAFLPVLAWVLGAPIVRSGKHRNLAVVGVLLALTAGNLAMHLGLGRSNPGLLHTGAWGSVYGVVLLMLLIAGRVVPLFTRNALRVAEPGLVLESDRRVGAAALAAAALALGLDLAAPGGVAGGIAAAVAAPLLFARQAFWRPGRTTGRSMLWILHVGHAWIAVGFACLAVASLGGPFPGASWLHAFTAGAMGSLVLGMMTRVALGHTGRPIEAGPWMTLAFALVVVAAALRVFSPWVVGGQTLPPLLASGVAFAAAYAIFAVRFAPILWRPRIEPAGAAALEVGPRPS